MNAATRQLTIIAALALCAAAGGQTMRSRDAHIKAEATRWTLGTAKATQGGRSCQAGMRAV